MVTNVNSASLNGNVYSNVYGQMFAPSMANDFFGSQIFGQNVYSQKNTTTTPIPISENPSNQASAILQAYAKANQTTTTSSAAPTMNDYVMATQIANMYSNNNNALLSMYSNFAQNDVFAQQTLPLMFNNGQAVA